MDLQLDQVTKKPLISQDSFPRYLALAEKSKRQLTSLLKLPDFSIKSHIVISVIIENSEKKSSKIDFVELCGSEQAVKDDTFYKGESVKDFVTRSFNSLSSQIVRIALNKKPKNDAKTTSLLVSSILASTLTPICKTVLICCISPSP